MPEASYILGATLVSPEGIGFPAQPRAITEDDIPSLRKRAEVLQAEGALAITQIHHAGRLALKGDLDVIAPSADENAREMTEDEVNKAIQSFAKATELCIKAGCDGVEIHGANNYLIQQFFSGATNKRTDSWGGSLANRLKFPLAVVKAVCEVREKLNKPDFVIGYRLSPEEPFDDGITMTDTIALIRALSDFPLQYLHVSQWNYGKTVRRGVGVGLPRLKIIHEAIEGKMPVIGAGSLITGADLDKALSTGFTEFVAVGQSLIINPGLGNILAEGDDSKL